MPNALHFIDKYTQVPRILNPVVAVLDELPKLYRDRDVRQYIDSAYGGLEECRKEILTDFCRHAFDGSGAWLGAVFASCRHSCATGSVLPHV